MEKNNSICGLQANFVTLFVEDRESFKSNSNVDIRLFHNPVRQYPSMTVQGAVYTGTATSLGCSQDSGTGLCL